jgi:hypothetical protein
VGGYVVPWAILFWASSWYVFSILSLWSAALSILGGVILEEFVSLKRYVDAVWWAVVACASPSW